MEREGERHHKYEAADGHQDEGAAEDDDEQHRRRRQPPPPPSPAGGGVVGVGGGAWTHLVQKMAKILSRKPREKTFTPFGCLDTSVAESVRTPAGRGWADAPPPRILSPDKSASAEVRDG